MAGFVPTLTFEHKYWARRIEHVAGVDEAGRGAWAGPVVAGAVILPRASRIKDWQQRTPLCGLAKARDSKLLSADQRERLVEPIHAAAVAWGTGLATRDEIDELGIVPATRLAMERALQALGTAPQGLLIDALSLPTLEVPQRAIIHGDRLSLSIACASILAKVTRDRLMVEMDARLPGYAFARHKGYGTAAHRAALEALGVSAQHRATFAPIRELAQAHYGQDSGIIAPSSSPRDAEMP
ncbi:MAG: ribonuclease HII [Chloroflexi bacterium]|nr:ribonuclease HII [Chloroflexota bacterium]